jgi:hypothetical protein
MANDTNRTQQNEGEGNRTAAKTYNDAQKRFAESGKVDQAAREAEQSTKGPEGEALREAERIGKSHAHGEDPAVKR